MRTDFIKKLISDIKVELSDEFDQNFERKAFFNQKWPSTKITNRKGSLMMRSGSLRRSISSKLTGNKISYQSSVPYASVHNEGGEIKVTAKMKKYFWAMYYKSSNAISKNKKGNSKRKDTLTSEARKWKNLALMPIGKTIKIEQRQFIGDHPKVKKLIEGVTKENLIHINKHFIKHINRQ